MHKTSLFLLVLAFFSCTSASAAFVEFGASANYRSSGYDSNNNIQSITYTGSVSYYFWEMCAFELSYTTGYAKQTSKGPSVIDPKDTVQDNIELASADLVFSFAGRQDPFRPYVKLGGGYLKKERFLQVDQGDTVLLARQEGLVPSGGVGLSLSLTSQFNIKFGLEAWTSPPKQKPVIVDYAGRAGVSWIF